MSLVPIERIGQHLRRAAFGLFAALACLVSIGFLTAAGYASLAQSYGNIIALFVVGGVYAFLAGLILLLTPKDKVPEPDRVTLGLAIGASFAEGFSAGRQVRR